MKPASTVLPGNTRPEAIATHDQGAVTDGLKLEHMQLLLNRSAETQKAADEFVRQQQYKNSPLYHHWITATEFGRTYGAAPEDVAAVKSWIETQGFQVNTVHSGGSMIDFSGTAGQVRKAFRTEIHHLNVNGEAHIANMSDPQIPAALAPAVRGIVAMHDFRFLFRRSQ